MMSDNVPENIMPSNRTMSSIKQEIDNPMTPTRSYHQVCSPSTTIQASEVNKNAFFHLLTSLPKMIKKKNKRINITHALKENNKNTKIHIYLST